MSLNVQNNTFIQRCEDDNLSCSICLGPYKNPYAIDKCLHAFCKECISPYETCPQCRIPFTAENLKNDFDKEERINQIRNKCLNVNKSARVESTIMQGSTPPAVESSSTLPGNDLHVGSFVELGNAVLIAIEEGRFSDVMKLLDQFPEGKCIEAWDGKNELCLVKASANPLTPGEVIERLLDKGLNHHMPENPKNFGYDRVMSPPVVAAREGNIAALKVFLDRGMYSISELRWAASYAVNCGQAKALDILFAQKRSFATNCSGDLETESIWERCDGSSIVIYANENNNVGLLRVVRKYFSNGFLCDEAQDILKNAGIL